MVTNIIKNEDIPKWCMNIDRWCLVGINNDGRDVCVHNWLTYNDSNLDWKNVKNKTYDDKDINPLNKW